MIPGLWLSSLQGPVTQISARRCRNFCPSSRPGAIPAVSAADSAPCWADLTPQVPPPPGSRRGTCVSSRRTWQQCCTHSMMEFGWFFFSRLWTHHCSCSSSWAHLKCISYLSAIGKESSSHTPWPPLDECQDRAADSQISPKSSLLIPAETLKLLRRQRPTGFLHKLPTWVWTLLGPVLWQHFLKRGSAKNASTATTAVLPGYCTTCSCGHYGEQLATWSLPIA